MMHKLCIYIYIYRQFRILYPFNLIPSYPQGWTVLGVNLRGKTEGVPQLAESCID